MPCINLLNNRGERQTFDFWPSYGHPPPMGQLSNFRVTLEAMSKNCIIQYVLLLKDSSLTTLAWCCLKVRGARRWPNQSINHSAVCRAASGYTCISMFDPQQLFAEVNNCIIHKKSCCVLRKAGRLDRKSINGQKTSHERWTLWL